MSKTLNLADCLLSTAQNLARVGEDRRALGLLTRLVRFRDLDATVAETAHVLLAELHHKGEKFGQARRHLTIALRYAPDSAKYLLKMAEVIEADPDVQPERARPYYRKAVKLAPADATAWADYGNHLLAMGEVRRGAKALTRAARLAGGEAALIGRIATSLRQEGLVERARRVLQVAMFHNRGDHRFASLMKQHRFHLLHEKQQRARRQGVAKLVEPTLLPFVAAPESGKYQVLGGKTIRMDRAAPLGTPKAPTRVPFQRPL